MSQRHSKNNNDLAFFTHGEKKKLGYGTQRERLGKDSIKPFDACCLCLKPFIDPLCCNKGHVFCEECILQCLLSQKKDIKRLEEHNSATAQDFELLAMAICSSTTEPSPAFSNMTRVSANNLF